MLTALRCELEAQRDNGAPFSSAWDSACERALVEVRQLHERVAWKRALAETRGGWRSAYQHQPDAKPARVAALEEAVA